MITVAVVDFKNGSGMFSLDALERNVPEMLKTELSHAGAGIVVVERRKLEMILQEQALGQTGLIDEKTAQAVGQLAGAQFLLTGEIVMAGARLRIDCHILNVATGRVRGEKVIGHDREVLDDMIRLLASNIVYNLAGEGQYRESLRVKQYPTKWLLASTLLAATAAGVTHALSREAYQQYQSATELDEFDKYYDRASDYRTARNVLAVVSGALAVATVNFWLKGNAEQNQVFAGTAPAMSARVQAFYVSAGAGGISLGWSLHY